jgi:glycosyltransferase involved in cell wall biosynthesis
VSDRVVFTGPRSDIQRILAVTDIFAMPCIEEGFGLAFVEAMAMKKPIIATRHGATPEVVEDGVNGLLSRPDDIEQLTRTLLTLIDDPEMRRRMGEVNRHRAETMFSPQRMADGIETVYRATLVRSGRWGTQ